LPSIVEKHTTFGYDSAMRRFAPRGERQTSQTQKISTMQRYRTLVLLLAGACAAGGASAYLFAGAASQETANASAQSAPPAGSPAATRVIDGKQLPAPDPPFGGKIQSEALQSKAWWPPRIVPPQKAPNILLVMTDDSGFGVPSTFGGVIPTATMDRVAKRGLRFNNIHSTALCSPPRAALITGRNHNSSGFGVVSQQATGFPGYNSIIGKERRPSAESCTITVTQRPGLARNTMFQRSRPVRTALSTNGQLVWASITSTDSSAAMPTNGSPIYFAIPRRFIPLRASPSGIW
jgi:hypothetical protein